MRVEWLVGPAKTGRAGDGVTGNGEVPGPVLFGDYMTQPCNTCYEYDKKTGKCWCGAGNCLAAPIPERKPVTRKSLCPTCGLFYCTCIDLNEHEHGPAHNSTPTSRAAAEAIAPVSKSLRETVYEYIVSCGYRGATDEEVQTALDMNPSTERPRRQELVKEGRIKSEGTRKTKSGRDANVWTAGV